MHLHVRFTRSPAQRAAALLAAYERHADRPPALGALYGYYQVLGRHRELVDGPARLAVLTADNLVLLDPHGEICQVTPLAQIAAYMIDADGRFVLRFDSPDGTSRVGSFRPIAGTDPALSVCQAAQLFVRQTTAAWEACTGTPFLNAWTQPDGRHVAPAR